MNYYSMERKVLYRKVIHEIAQSYSYSTNIPFTMPLHCHKEYELIYIIAGHGQEFIGNSMKRYTAGDLILIGSGVPHLHLCDSVIDKQNKQKSMCDILQFPPNIFPENLASIPEYLFVNSILEKSLYGIKFQANEIERTVLKFLRNMNKKNGIERIISLTKMLDLLGKSKDITLISPIKYISETFITSQEELINRVYTYLISNFRKEITLKDIADYIKLNPASLCRYFKQRTGKTIFVCLNEVRIEHACNLLSNTDLTISQIAYEVGFNNLSHFNKQFKYLIQQTPTKYREHLMIDL